MQVPTWRAIVRPIEEWADGLWLMDRPQDFRRFLRELVGQRITIQVRKDKPQRSAKQNARYFALLTVAARELGYDTVEDLHDGIAFRLLPLPEIVPGIPRRRRTPSLNTAEFVEYTDAVERFLIMELHVDLTGWESEADKLAGYDR